MERLKNKVAIVTGSGDGIGRATAVLFAKEGAKVVIADLAVAKGKATEAIIKKDGGEAYFVRSDISRTEDVRFLIKETLATYGRLDVLINNAGIQTTGSVLDTTEEDWDKTLSINVKGPFLCTKYAAPEMAKSGGGVIINISSVLALAAIGRQTAYAASKGAVLSMTRDMAIDLAPKNIRVCSVVPGMTLTTRVKSSFRDDPNANIEQFAKKHILGRAAEPEEIARPILFLVSEDASFMTGTSLMIEGGRTAW